MIDWLTTAVQVSALAVAAWFLVLTLRKRPFVTWHRYLLGGLEIVVVAQAVVSIVLLTGMPGSDEMIMFIGYLATAVLIAPVAAIWGSIDRSHWGSAVVAGACATIAVLVLRMDQVWRIMEAAA